MQGWKIYEWNLREGMFQLLHFHPCITVPIFPLPHFPPNPCVFLLFRANISTPAFTTPAFSVPPHKPGRYILNIGLLVKPFVAKPKYHSPIFLSRTENLIHSTCRSGPNLHRFVYPCSAETPVNLPKSLIQLKLSQEYYFLPKIINICQHVTSLQLMTDSVEKVLENRLVG